MIRECAAASPLARFAGSGHSQCAREDSNLRGPYSPRGQWEGRQLAPACERESGHEQAPRRLRGRRRPRTREAAPRALRSSPGWTRTSSGKAVQRAALPAPASRQRNGRRGANSSTILGLTGVPETSFRSRRPVDRLGGRMPATSREQVSTRPAPGTARSASRRFRSGSPSHSRTLYGHRLRATGALVLAGSSLPFAVVPAQKREALAGGDAKRSEDAKRLDRDLRGVGARRATVTRPDLRERARACKRRCATRAVTGVEWVVESRDRTGGPLACGPPAARLGRRAER